jgi:asparagine synthase (glutamine-hydrolysing)
MCGLTGFVALEPRDRAEALEELRNSAAAIAHRGPDGSGVWVDPSGRVGLGHRRLSIIDLSPAGAQPMNSDCGRFTIAFNGEIYNYRELRAQLDAAGVRFRGHSDTEVLLYAFRSWGIEATLKRAYGMFAIALWDRERQELTLARDRLGEKPLYYAECGSTFVFGSELKALRALSGWRGAPSATALRWLLRLNYIPAPWSIYDSTFKLEPGSMLTLGVNGGRFTTRRQKFWDIEALARAGSESPLDGSPEEVVDQVDSLVRKAVARQMVSDVPIGAFLSGGVDSSLVVATMQASSSKPVRTFTVAFKDKKFDESPYARAIATHLGTDHSEEALDVRDALDLIPSLPDVYDEPFGDSSQLPTMLVCRMARRHVTVALSGDAGDEFFGGYDRYADIHQRWSKLRRVPHFLRSVAGGAFSRISDGNAARVVGMVRPGATAAVRENAGRRLRARGRAWTWTQPMQLYAQTLTAWPDHMGILPPAVDSWPELGGDQRDEADCRRQLMMWDARNYLPDDILVKVDRAAMTNSLETRVPLLDPELVELSLRIPAPLHWRDGSGKWLLRQVLGKYVPRALTERPKMGFAVPLGSWLRTELRDWAEELLAPNALLDAGFVDPAPILERWRQHKEGVQDWSMALWTILALQSWRARHLGR